MPSLQYNYHDAELERVELTVSSLCLYVSLYPIFYPEKPTVKLSFSVGNRLEKCAEWVEDVLKNADDDSLCATIYSIELRLSKKKAQYLMARIEGSFETLQFKVNEFEEQKL